MPFCRVVGRDRICPVRPPMRAPVRARSHAALDPLGEPSAAWLRGEVDSPVVGRNNRQVVLVAPILRGSGPP